MHRPTIAVLAIVLLCGGLYLSLAGGDDAFGRSLNAACWRVGGLLIAIWIAHPQLERWPSWLYLLLLVVAITVAIRPRLALVLVPLLLVTLWLRPRNKSAPPTR